MAAVKRKPPKRKPPAKKPAPRQQPPTIDVTGAASPIEESPEDYRNADAIYSTGGGAVQSYHYDRKPTYRDQMAAEANQAETVSGPGQAGQA
jgi:hypothetical protein